MKTFPSNQLHQGELIRKLNWRPQALFDEKEKLQNERLAFCCLTGSVKSRVFYSGTKLLKLYFFSGTDKVINLKFPFGRIYIKYKRVCINYTK